LTAIATPLRHPDGIGISAFHRNNRGPDFRRDDEWGVVIRHWIAIPFLTVIPMKIGISAFHRAAEVPTSAGRHLFVVFLVLLRN
jgi:hypothetical protein